MSMNDALWRILQNVAPKRLPSRYATDRGFDSQSEQRLYDACVKACAAITEKSGTLWKAERQVELAGHVRDILLTCGQWRINVECDGNWYHQFLRDAVRDHEIITTQEAHTIYRFDSHDAFHQPDRCATCVIVTQALLLCDRPDQQHLTEADREALAVPAIVRHYDGRQIRPSSRRWWYPRDPLGRQQSRPDQRKSD